MPVLCAVNEGTDIGKIVEAYDCGMSTIHGDMENFISAIKKLSENKSLREYYSINCRKLLKEKYTSARAYNIIVDNLN